MDGDTIAALTEALSVGCAGRSGDSDGSVSLVGTDTSDEIAGGLWRADRNWRKKLPKKFEDRTANQVGKRTNERWRQAKAVERAAARAAKPVVAARLAAHMSSAGSSKRKRASEQQASEQQTPLLSRTNSSDSTSTDEPTATAVKSTLPSAGIAKSSRQENTRDSFDEDEQDSDEGGGEVQQCLRDGDIKFFFGKFVVEAKKGELVMRKAKTGESYIKTSVFKLAGFDAKEDADPDHDDDRDDDDDDDDDCYAYADKMLERLWAKSRGKLGDKAEQSPDEVRVLIFAKGRSSAPQIVTSGSELLTALQTLWLATSSGSSCSNGAGEFTVSLPAAGSLKKHKKKEGKKKGPRKKSPSFSDSDDSKSCASSSNSDDVTAGFSSGKGGASNMRQEHIDERKLGSICHLSLLRDRSFQSR
jgi:hypothetical protein